MKKKYIAWLLSANSLNRGEIHSHLELIKKLAKEFDKLYIINFVYLKLFSESYIKKGKFNSKLSSKIELPKNIEIFCPKNSKEFASFMSDKEIVGIHNMGRNLSDLRANLILKKFNITIIQISNIGFYNSAIPITKQDLANNFLKVISYYINKKIGQKLTLLLSNLGLAPKVDIRFISDLSIIKSIKKSFIKNLLFKLNFFHAKELILINSRTFDEHKSINYRVFQKKIVLLDAMVNHPEQKSIRGNYNKKKILRHYYNLNIFLKKISKLFNKPIYICIHPKDNIKEKRKIFKSFKVLQFETKKNIYESFIVLFFDTSAVIDAIFLKKNIINLSSKDMPIAFNDIADNFVKRAGILKLNLNNYSLPSNKKLLIDLKKRKLNYKKYISNYISPDHKTDGRKKVIKIIKKRYF